MDPTHLVAKIGYQGIRCYVTATDPTLRSEEKLNEPGFIFFTQVRKLKKNINLVSLPAAMMRSYRRQSVSYFGGIAQLIERNAVNVDVLGSSPSAPGRVFVFLA